MSSHTIKLAPLESASIQRFFAGHGFEFDEVPHAFWRAKGPGCNATFYKSGKLLLQGKEADVYRGLLSDETPDARPYYRALQKHPKPAPPSWIGTDETGKGDYFGPLVVAGAVVKRADLEILQTLGVDDSKAVSDKKVGDIERALKGLCAHEVLFITPAKYNELHPKMGNINRLMAWAHGKVIETLLEKTADWPVDARPTWVLVDRFAKDHVMRRALGPLGREARFDQRPKAEEDPAVAAASIFARAAYLRGLGSLGRRFGMKLPGGAGKPVLTAGRRFLETHGRGQLGQVAKLHFDTTRQIGG